MCHILAVHAELLNYTVEFQRVISKRIARNPTSITSLERVILKSYSPCPKRGIRHHRHQRSTLHSATKYPQCSALSCNIPAKRVTRYEIFARHRVVEFEKIVHPCIRCTITRISLGTWPRNRNAGCLTRIYYFRQV